MKICVHDSGGREITSCFGKHVSQRLSFLLRHVLVNELVHGGLVPHGGSPVFELAIAKRASPHSQVSVLNHFRLDVGVVDVFLELCGFRYRPFGAQEAIEFSSGANLVARMVFNLHFLEHWSRSYRFLFLFPLSSGEHYSHSCVE